MTDVPWAYERYLVPEFFVPCAELLVRLAAPVAGERAVDLACGTGAVARRLADRGLSVTGVDLSGAMVAFAAAAEPRVDWRVAPAGALPLGAGTADLVCCQQDCSSSPTRPARCATCIVCSCPAGGWRWRSGAGSSTTPPGRRSSTRWIGGPDRRWAP